MIYFFWYAMLFISIIWPLCFHWPTHRPTTRPTNPRQACWFMRKLTLAKAGPVTKDFGDRSLAFSVILQVLNWVMNGGFVVCSTNGIVQPIVSFALGFYQAILHSHAKILQLSARKNIIFISCSFSLYLYSFMYVYLIYI